MGHRDALQIHTALPFDRIPCRIDGILGRGSNAITYYGRGFPMEGDSSVRNVLIQELFPSHPQGLIRRDETGWIRKDPEAAAFFERHRESFLCTQEIYDRWSQTKPGRSGKPMELFSCNGTWYSLVPFSGIRTLKQALAASEDSAESYVDRMLGLLDALEAYHRCGYLHLGIDPDQILLVDTEEGEQVYLLQNEVFADFREPDEVIYRPGYAPPEMESGFSEMLDFSTDLYSVAAVFFHCLMGRAMSLEELLDSGAPSVRESGCLEEEAYPVYQMVNRILKKGLQVLPAKRYRSVSQMRKAFLELKNRIRNHGVTHWALWENGRRGGESWLRNLSGKLSLDPLLDAWQQQGKKYSPTAPALVRLSLAGVSGKSGQGIRREVLSSLRVSDDTVAGAALDELLEVPAANNPVLLVLEDLAGFADEGGELELLSRKEGVRLLDETGKAVTAEEIASRKDSGKKAGLESCREESGGKCPGDPECYEIHTVFGGKTAEENLPVFSVDW